MKRVARFGAAMTIFVGVVAAAAAACDAFSSSSDDPPAVTPPPSTASDAGVDGSISNVDSSGPDFTKPKSFIGLYNSEAKLFYVRYENAPGSADVSILIDEMFTDLQPVAGHWNAGGVPGDTIGFFNAGTWYLAKAPGMTPAYTTISFGAKGEIAFAGDWNGDGITRIGVYSPKVAAFFLREADDGGTSQFNFAAPNLVPLAGDWDGDGKDGIGVYDPADGAVFLKNVPGPGNADITITTASNRLPITGDWNGDGIDTIGLYDQATAVFQLYEANDDSKITSSVQFGSPGAKAVPFAGKWARP